ncbi:unnamed protein product [marine sediment metagenome]|uniref:Uncharacterized protein n=1 Tax=marine sediment metagenome TaxID=412755 RepID=X0SBB3_9ZZZZ
MAKINPPIRCSKELKHIINQVRTRAILEGKRPPKISRITKIIAKRINVEELIKDVFVEI